MENKEEYKCVKWDMPNRLIWRSFLTSAFFASIVVAVLILISDAPVSNMFSVILLIVSYSIIGIVIIYKTRVSCPGCKKRGMKMEGLPYKPIKWYCKNCRTCWITDVVPSAD